MREQIPLANGVEIILTEGEHGYRDVLADAQAEGGELFIVAYAITTGGDGMLGILQQGIPGISRIEFVTAIPKFNQREWSGHWREAASKEIRDYLALLHPDVVHESVSVAIVMNSHAKMAISDRIAYVGSANFSDASAKKKEAGVLIRDPELARAVRSRFKTTFVHDIYPYGPDADSLLAAFALLTESREILRELVAGIHEYRDPETDALMISPSEVDLVQRWVSKAAPALDLMLEVVDGNDLILGGIELPGAMNSELLRADIQVLEDNSLTNFLRFSREEYVERRVQELTAHSPDDLDAASEQANQEAEEELAELFEQAWLIVEPLLDRLEALPEALDTGLVGLRKAIEGLTHLRA